MNELMPRNVWLALLESIHSYKGIALDGQEWAECALCDELNLDCEACPIGRDGHAGCMGTPWDEWTDHLAKHKDGYDGDKVYCPTCAEHVERELDYLCHLAKRALKAGITKEPTP